MLFFVSKNMEGKKRAQQISCMGNLRQIGNALNLYAAEHNGHLPGPEYAIVNLNGHLVQKLLPYIEDKKLWRCPANPTMDEKFSTYKTRTPFFGYYYAPPKESLTSYTILQIKENYPIEDQWVIEDIDAWNYAPQPRLGKGVDGPVHQSARNRLFIDSRVELVNAEPPIP